MLPPQIAQANCSEVFTSANSLLDLYVRGCTNFGILPVLAATQPDHVVPNAAPAGAGGPYRLFTGAGNIVNRCADRTGATVDLDACLDAAAYSTFFRLATDRVIFK